MRVQLGCGSTPKQGYVNVDVVDLPTVDQVVDLNVLPWPWADNSIEEVFASDALEHLAPLGRAAGQLNILAVLGEIHRVLEPGGLLEVIVPSTDGPGAWQDPTHITYWNKNTFLYFITPNIYSGHYMDKYPKFEADGRDLGIADSELDDYGVLWACARLRKPALKTALKPAGAEQLKFAFDGGGAAEGADAE